VIDRTRDACQFIQHHKPTIEESPLQIYASALVFSPTQSITRNQFIKEEPNWIKTKPIMEDDWNSCLLTLEGHNQSVQAVSWASDNRLASASFDGTVKMWDTSTSHCLSTFSGDESPVSSLGWLRDTKLGLVLGDGRIETWGTTEDSNLPPPKDGDQPVKEPISSFKDTIELFKVASWSPQGTLAFAVEDGSIWIRPAISVTQRQPSIPLRGTHRGVFALAWSHDGRIASGARDGTLKIWDTADRTCKLEPGGHSEWVYALAWSHDCQRLASASKENVIKIWETKSGRCTSWIQGQNNLIRSLSWSPDGRLAGADGETIKIWDHITGECLSRLEGHRHQVWSVAWSENGTRLASASRDKTIKIWDVAGDRKEQPLSGHSQRVKKIAWSADKTKLVSVSEDSTVIVWDIRTRDNVQNRISNVHSVAWSKDGTRIAFVAGHNVIVIWNIVTGDCVQTPTDASNDISSVVWSEDGTKLASVSKDYHMKFWDLSSEECVEAASQEDASTCPLTWSDVVAEPETLDLDTALSSTNPMKYGINSEDAWITSNGKRQLRLPPGYNVECSAILPERIGIGCGSGRVLTFTVSEATAICV
jgi:WD40 repeat protein